MTSLGRKFFVESGKPKCQARRISRRSASTYLLTDLIEWRWCGRAVEGTRARQGLRQVEGQRTCLGVHRALEGQCSIHGTGCSSSDDGGSSGCRGFGGRWVGGPKWVVAGGGGDGTPGQTDRRWQAAELRPELTHVPVAMPRPVTLDVEGSGHTTSPSSTTPPLHPPPNCRLPQDGRIAFATIAGRSIGRHSAQLPRQVRPRFPAHPSSASSLTIPAAVARRPAARSAHHAAANARTRSSPASPTPSSSSSTA